MLNGLCGEQRLESTDAKSTSPKVPNSQMLSLSFSKLVFQLLHLTGRSQKKCHPTSWVLLPCTRFEKTDTKTLAYQNQILKTGSKCTILKNKTYSKSSFTISVYSIIIIIIIIIIIRIIIIIIITIIIITITITIIIIIIISSSSSIISILIIFITIITIIIMTLVNRLFFWTSILQHRNPDLQRLLPQTFNFLPLLFSSSSCRRILSLARRPTKEIQTSFFSLLPCRICIASTSASFSLSCCTWQSHTTL